MMNKLWFTLSFVVLLFAALLRTSYAQGPTSLFLPTVMTRQNDGTAEASAGFDARAIPVEMQAWWTPAYGHVHTAAKLPFAQTVSGVISIPIRIVMHDNPGKLHRFDVWDGRPVLLTYQLMGDLTCNVSVCAWAVTAVVDTTKMNDGCQELRIRSTVRTPDGKEMLESSGVPVYVDNGKADQNFNNSCTTHQLIGRGWYTGFDYTNAVISNLPIAPISGLYTFQVRAQNASAHLFVALDKSHFIPAVSGWEAAADNPGFVLFDKDGSYLKLFPLTVDTRTLANGWHNIQVKSTKPTGAVSVCNGCPSGVKSFPSGIAKFWFYVQN